MDPALWQLVEFGGYAADLAAWEQLASACEGSVLELGAGAGRVAFHLAERGHDVLAAEVDPGLVSALRRRVADRAESLPGGVTVLSADLERPDSLAVPIPPALAIGPLHLIQIVAPAARPRLLARLAEVTAPGGKVALTLVAEATLTAAADPPAGRSASVPEMRDLDGWVYSSEPLWVEMGDDELRIRRLRQSVDPDGNLDRSAHDELLHRLTPEELEAEAAAAGLSAVERRAIPSGPNEAGSILVLLAVDR